MLGAIAGDIIGSAYEHAPIKTEEFSLFHPRCRFTDDTVMTVAIAYAILESVEYARAMKHFGRKYPNAGYGSTFIHWIFQDEIHPYNSWGNGAAMRVSPVGFAFGDLDTVLSEAKRTAEVSHNHPEGIKGAQATAAAVFLARQGESKENIRRQITKLFGYDLNRTVDEIRPSYDFDISCQGTVPEAIIAFLDSCNYENAIRKAISLGGDSDTLACITGGIAEAYYKSISPDIVHMVRRTLPAQLWQIVEKFYQRFDLRGIPLTDGDTKNSEMLNDCESK